MFTSTISLLRTFLIGAEQQVFEVWDHTNHVSSSFFATALTNCLRFGSMLQLLLLFAGRYYHASTAHCNDLVDKYNVKQLDLRKILFFN